MRWLGVITDSIDICCCSVVSESFLDPMDSKQYARQTPGDSDEQGSLARFSSWSRRIGHDRATEQQPSSTTLRRFFSSLVPDAPGYG